MICPQCQRDFWALFICDDGVYRCRADRDSRPVLVVPDKVNTDGTQRPYVTRYKGKKK